MQQILVVDDSAFVRKHLTKALVGAGFGVHAVGSGCEAVAYYQAARPDLVILDVVMPEMDGLETYRALRAVCGKVRVLGISGIEPRFPSMYLKLIRALGAEGVLEKPFSDEVLIQTVREIIALPESPDGYASRFN